MVACGREEPRTATTAVRATNLRLDVLGNEDQPFAILLRPLVGQDQRAPLPFRLRHAHAAVLPVAPGAGEAEQGSADFVPFKVYGSSDRNHPSFGNCRLPRSLPGTVGKAADSLRSERLRYSWRFSSWCDHPAAFGFAAARILCTRPPGWERAVISLFWSAAGAVQMDQLNQ